MEINEYIEKKKKMQELLLTYLENENNVEENYQNFIDYCNIEKIGKNKFDLEILLLQLYYISKYHHRFPSFMSKIETILNNFKNEIKQSFSIKWIVKKFQKNKRLLLYFLKSKIIESNIDFYNNLREFLSGIGEVRREEYYAYFFPELKQIFKDTFSKKIEGRIKDSPEIYEQKRELGENDNYICELIRNDSIDEFINFVTQNKIELSSRIERSFYETNCYLLRKPTELIEYSAFFGSTKIFKYLFENGAKYSDYLWIYVIHGNNSEIINYLEEKKVPPSNKPYCKYILVVGDDWNHVCDDNVEYEACLKKTFRCFHSQLSNYFIEKYLHCSNNDDSIDLYSKTIQCAIYRDNDDIVELLLTTYGIVDYNFYGCQYFKRISIPNTVKSIGKKAFYGCVDLLNIDIPPSVTYIGVNAFEKCTSLKSVSLPASISKLEDYLFYCCSALKQITIPNSVKIIGDYTFSSCKSLKDISIPDSVESIGKEAFSDCRSLKEITIPRSVKSIGEKAFYKCKSLESINIPMSLKVIGKNAFQQKSNIVKY